MRLSHPSFRAAVPVVLLAGALGCGFQDKVQQAHAMQDLAAISHAAQAGQPIPELSAEAGRYGKYRPLLVHFRGRFQLMKDLVEDIHALEAKANGCLAPAELGSPEARTAHRAELQKLEEDLGQMREAMDQTAGPGALKVVEGMSLGPGVMEGFKNGIGGRGSQVEALMAKLETKRRYYEKVRGMVEFAERSHAAASPTGQLRLAGPAEVASYQAQVREIQALEAEVNAGAKQAGAGS